VAGDHREAARLQLQFALFPAKWMHRGLTPTMKAAMRILGRAVGDIHPPFQGLTAAEIEDLRAYLATTDLRPAENTTDAAA
jgi:4-hydroxy-tetrahydrodipicolinate synthase